MGLTLPLELSGDFEITAAFEVLHAEEPPPVSRSYGIGVLLSVNESARVGRLYRARGNRVVTWDHWAGPSDNRRFLLGAAPAKGKSVRLRLKRTNTILRMLWAPGTEGDTFQDIHQFEFGADDLNRVRLELNADLGRKPGALDVRLLKLTIRSSGLTADPTADPEERRAGRSKAWLVAAGICALALLLVPLVAWLLAAKKRRTADAPPTPGDNTEGPSERAGEIIPLACSGCGKRLRAKAGLAGKSVHCPQCRTAIMVPEKPPS
jgi:hypothetical protein